MHLNHPRPPLGRDLPLLCFKSSQIASLVTLAIMLSLPRVFVSLLQLNTHSPAARRPLLPIRQVSTLVEELYSSCSLLSRGSRLRQTDVGHHFASRKKARATCCSNKNAIDWLDYQKRQLLMCESEKRVRTGLEAAQSDQGQGSSEARLVVPTIPRCPLSRALPRWGLVG